MAEIYRVILAALAKTVLPNDEWHTSVRPPESPGGKPSDRVYIYHRPPGEAVDYSITVLVEGTTVIVERLNVQFPENLRTIITDLNDPDSLETFYNTIKAVMNFANQRSRFNPLRWRG